MYLSSLRDQMLNILNIFGFTISFDQHFCWGDSEEDKLEYLNRRMAVS